MKKLLLLGAVTIGAIFVLSGCVVHRHRYHGHPHHSKVVVVERGHAHSHDCGHYFHEGKWHHWHGHVHAAGCGHHHVNGRWEVDVKLIVK